VQFFVSGQLVALIFPNFSATNNFLFLHAEVLRQLTTLNGFASATG